MSDSHALQVSVTLTPHGKPHVQVRLAGQCHDLVLTHSCTVDFDLVVDSDQCLEIELCDKHDLDSCTAVQIDQVSIFGINDARFTWAGQYWPVYPEPWASQQTQSGTVLDNCLKSQTYLGWRGVWRLELPVPVFTWMHQTQSLGTIYT
jgi:hypothetical protein